MKPLRVLCFSDPHGGHQAGLTPPDYWYPIISKPRNSLQRRRNKFAELQRQVWKWYIKTIEELQPIYALFDLGDNVDGRGEKSGCTELITTDQHLQCDIAVRAIEKIKAKRKYFVYGTPYHVSEGYQDWEDLVADGVNADKIGSREFIEVNGTIFDLKHHIGRSSSPYGQGTLNAKEKMWNYIWNHLDLQPFAHVTLRGHIHSYWVDGPHEWKVMTLNALEWSSKFGTRIAQGRVSVGLTHFDVYGPNDYDYKDHQCLLGIMKAKLIKA